MLNLRPTPKVITFDCYGTLVQWHEAVRRAAARILARTGSPDGAGARAASFASDIRAAATARQDRAPFCEFRSVLKAALAAAMPPDLGPATADDESLLISTLSQIPAHPDTPDALERLRTRYRLAIISNTDDDIMAGTLAALGVPVDHLVTARQARAYKPDHRLFLHAWEVIGVRKDDTVHVAMGQHTDLKVCRELGIRSVWINRAGEPLDPAWSPDAILPDLSGLPDLLLAAG